MPDKKSFKQDDAAYASDELAAKVAANLEGIEGGGEPEPDEDSTLNDSNNQADDDDSTLDDSSSADDEDSTLDDSDDSTDSDGDDAPTIPEHLFRAARHHGWEVQEISDLYKQNPKLAEKTLIKIHDDMNKVSQVYSKWGKISKQQQTAMPQQQQTDNTQQQQVDDFVDIAKLRKEYEDNPLVDVISTLNEGLKKVVDGQKPQQTQQQTDMPQQDTFQDDMAAIQQINSFLGSEDMKYFNDYYGPIADDSGIPLLDWRSLQPGQQANRKALVQEADLILAGADIIGKKMTVADALNMAHLTLTAPMQGQIARKKVTSELKKRSKGITLRSSGSKKAADKGGQKTEEQLVAITEQRLKRLYG